LPSRLDLAPIDAALAFQARATEAVEAGEGDGRQPCSDGLAVTAGNVKVYDRGLPVLL
jgi:hypothetical protein